MYKTIVSYRNANNDRDRIEFYDTEELLGEDFILLMEQIFNTNTQNFEILKLIPSNNSIPFAYNIFNLNKLEAELSEGLDIVNIKEIKDAHELISTSKSIEAVITIHNENFEKNFTNHLIDNISECLFNNFILMCKKAISVYRNETSFINGINRFEKPLLVTAEFNPSPELLILNDKHRKIKVTNMKIMKEISPSSIKTF